MYVRNLFTDILKVLIETKQQKTKTYVFMNIPSKDIHQNKFKVGDQVALNLT